jgi:hypothetical protein
VLLKTMPLLSNVTTVLDDIMEILIRLRRLLVLYEGIHRNELRLINLLAKEIK